MIVFLLFLCLAAYYVYLLVNPSTHYTALSYAPLAAVVTGFFVAVARIPVLEDPTGLRIRIPRIPLFPRVGRLSERD